MAFQLGECQLLVLIERKGWSQAEFAKRMKCSRQYVNDLIKNKSNMSLTFAINAAELLDCNVKDLHKLIRDSD